ncbi:MAG: tetratricopeptide repeat protein [bacterium]|nr:tetratricopeptide repeat protein [bacterium]
MNRWRIHPDRRVAAALARRAPRCVTSCVAFCFLLAVLPAAVATAQDGGRAPGLPEIPGFPQERMMRPQTLTGVDVIELRRRLSELDRLLVLGSAARAAALLDELAQHSALSRELVTRRIELEQLRGDHAAAAALCRQAVAEQPLNPSLWRELASSLLALDQPDSARLALDRFLANSPNLRSSGLVSVEMLRAAGRPVVALALIDSLRSVLREPRFQGLERAVVLLAVDRQEDAAEEAHAELVSGPYNLALLRTALLEGPYKPGLGNRFRARLLESAQRPDGSAAALVLVANLMVVEGQAAQAVELVAPLAARPDGALLLLQNAVVLMRERAQDVVDAPATVAARSSIGSPSSIASPSSIEAQATIDYLLGTLDALSGAASGAPSLRVRAADLLAETCELALGRGLLGPDPRAAAVRFDEILARVRAVNPGSEFLYSSRIRLATYRRDVLGEAREAARGLERLATDMNLPTEGLAMVRLTLGECYLAAGDTARGRQVLTALGRDPEFRQAGGHAHYHLARLDLAEGHYATARDRFAVIALDNPAAPYANDALDLGLALAEELENPGGGPTILQWYAQGVYAELTSQPAARLAALERFVQEATARLDTSEPQHLLERGRFELAKALVAAGRRDEAATQLEAIVAQHPRGRFPGAALQMLGRLRLEDGRTDLAREAWERLLAQYPGFLFSDDVRDELRRLPR